MRSSSTTCAFPEAPARLAARGAARWRAPPLPAPLPPVRRGALAARRRSAAPRISAILLAAGVASNSSGSSSGRGARAVRLRSLIDRHFDFVWRSARRLGLSPADADDAAQEVFIVLARRLDDVEPPRERSFLFGTLLRTVATRRRSSGRRREELAADVELEQRAAHDADAELDPEALSELAGVRPLLDVLLDALPEAQRAVFILYELEELELAEIAELLDIPGGTVASRLRAARSAFEAAAERLRAREGRPMRLVPSKPRR
jgi:RNA polymerase sigma-70 factor, ECF subfamily